MKKVQINDAIDEWLLYKRCEIKESTYRLYKYKCEKYLKVYFANKNLSYFQYFDLNLYKNDLLNENLSSKTIKGILKYCELKYDMNFKLDLVSKPKTHKKEIKILTEYEQKKLKNYCIESKELREVGILICLYGGLRIGEVCGLKWEDVDIVKRVIYIKRTIQRVYLGKKNTKILIGTPKTENSIRKIPMANIIYEKLRTIKAKSCEKAYLLTGSTEKFIEPRNFQYWFIRDLKKCNIEKYNFHALRHTFATNCIKVGMDVKSLSEILGHSDVSITLNRYVHSSDKLKKKFINRL